jgi:haloalkane dehalogenase
MMRLNVAEVVAGPGVWKALYPFEPRTLDLGGLRYSYLDEGRGEPVVMVHGNPTWSFYFRELVLGLRDHYRTIVPDHIGCGRSDKPGDDHYDYRLRRRVIDLESLLEHLQLRENLTLVLHDWGGMIGMAFAHRHPERVRRLVLLNTAAFLLPAGKKLPWSLRLCRNRIVGPLLVRGCNGFCRAALRWCSAKPLSPAARAGYLAPYDDWANRIAVLRFVQDIPLNPGDPSYELVKEVQDGLAQFQDRPVLICWGERDFVFDGHFLDEWRRRFPGAELHPFSNAGHFILEDAGQEVLSIVRAFLRCHSLDSP